MPRVYALQYEIVWEQKAENHRLIERMVADAEPPEGSLIVLPEMFDTGFTMNVQTMAEEVTDHVGERWASRFARQKRIFVQAASIRRPGGGAKATNNAVVFNPDGELICRYEKVFPFSGGREPEHYRGGEAVYTFDWHGIRVCPLICYDLRFPELWRLALLDHGAEMFTIGASWPAPRQAHWSKLLEARAIENQAYVVGVNRCGSDPFLDYLGGSKIVDPQGGVVSEAAETFACLQGEIDPAAPRDWRESFAALSDTRRDLLGRLVTDKP